MSLTINAILSFSAALVFHEMGTFLRRALQVPVTEAGLGWAEGFWFPSQGR